MKRQQKSDHNAFVFSLPCQGKRHYETKAKALEAADLRMLDHLGLEIAVYQCPVCQQWHLTSVKKDRS